MQDHEIRALLGPVYDAATAEQRDAIDRAATAIDARWPDPDLADTRREALTGAMLVTLGDDTLEGIASAWHRARVVERDAHAALTGALIASAGTEVDLAARAQITRPTVRKALGK